MKKYQSYKSTGIEWIGDVPEHWENRKFKWDVFYQNYSSGQNCAIAVCENLEIT